ncbi:putative activator of hsp90 ATPase [Cryptosporidium felis]|nr:putative activator of hsp90 ATPase [Cryptosporidium felis]
MTEISGSVWNANNWHWEEKDYSKWSREELTVILENFKYHFEVGHSNLHFLIEKVSINGEASISVRKKQPILAYEFSISGNWSIYEQDTRNKIIEGQFSIPEFSIDNYEESFPINITSKEVVKSEYDLKMLILEVKKKTCLQIRNKMSEFHLSLLNKENNQGKIKNEKEKREEEQKIAEVARIEKQEEKQRIYNQQIEKEALNHQRELVGTSNDHPDSLRQAHGSVWNVNNWHWEEKPETNWVIETLTRKIEDLSLNLSGIDNLGDIKVGFSGVNVTGEASSSVRKGKKICVLDCCASGIFKANIKEGGFDLKKEINLTGIFSLSELNVMDTHDYKSKISFDSTELGVTTSRVLEFIDVKEKLKEQILLGLDSAVQEFCSEFLNK